MLVRSSNLLSPQGDQSPGRINVFGLPYERWRCQSTEVGFVISYCHVSFLFFRDKATVVLLLIVKLVKDVSAAFGIVNSQWQTRKNA
jgi:hypothetical protein